MAKNDNQLRSINKSLTAMVIKIKTDQLNLFWKKEFKYYYFVTRLLELNYKRTLIIQKFSVIMFYFVLLFIILIIPKDYINYILYVYFHSNTFLLLFSLKSSLLVWISLYYQYLNNYFYEQYKLRQKN